MESAENLKNGNDTEKVKVTVRVWKGRERWGWKWRWPYEKTFGHASIEVDDHVDNLGVKRDGFYASLWPYQGSSARQQTYESRTQIPNDNGTFSPGMGCERREVSNWCGLPAKMHTLEEDDYKYGEPEEELFTKVDLYHLNLENMKKKYESLCCILWPNVIVLDKEEEVSDYKERINEGSIAIFHKKDNDFVVYYKTNQSNCHRKEIDIKEIDIKKDDGLGIQQGEYQFYIYDKDDKEKQGIKQDEKKMCEKVIKAIKEKCESEEAYFRSSGYWFFSQRGPCGKNFYSCNGFVEQLLQAGGISSIVESYNDITYNVTHSLYESSVAIGVAIGAAAISTLLFRQARTLSPGVLLFSGALGGIVGFRDNQLDNITGKNMVSTPEQTLALVIREKEKEIETDRKQILSKKLKKRYF